MANLPERTGPAVTWQQIAAGSSVVAVGALASLIIVLALNDSDALATVALSLAIVTFITQILVFIAQTWTTSQLNAETRGFLQELQTSAHGTEKALNTQVDKLTDHILRNFESARKRDDGSSAGELRRRVREDVAEVLKSQPPLSSAPAGLTPEPAVSDRDQRLLDELASFPDEEEGLQSLEVLKALSPITVSTLRRYGEDERKSREIGGDPGLPLADEHPFSKEAIEAGLLEYDTQTRGKDWARLTEKGRQVARLLVSAGEPPAWLRANS